MTEIFLTKTPEPIGPDSMDARGPPRAGWARLEIFPYLTISLAVFTSVS